jgi:hypothetical protein
MNYIEELRQAIWAELPNLGEDLLDLYTLVGCVRGIETSNFDVHEAWSVWKNRTMPDHRSLIPFEELTAEVQDLDSKYRDGIIRAVKAVRGF